MSDQEATPFDGIRDLRDLRALRLWLVFVAVPFALAAAAAAIFFARDDVQAPRTLSTEIRPQGDWVGRYGNTGYVLFGWKGDSGDLISLPAGIALSIDVGDRFAWPNTPDQRALASPDRSTHKPAILFGAREVHVELTFGRAYSGTLRLYAVDWDTTERRETIRIDDGSRSGIADLSYDFSSGVWVTAPVSIAPAGRVAIDVTRTGGASAVLSGIFLD